MFSENEQRNCLTGTIQTAAAVELIVNNRNIDARRLICQGRFVSRLGCLNDLIISGRKTVVCTIVIT